MIVQLCTACATFPSLRFNFDQCQLSRELESQRTSSEVASDLGLFQELDGFHYSMELPVCRLWAGCARNAVVKVGLFVWVAQTHGDGKGSLALRLLSPEMS